jgi:Tol biopolymer transport system component
MRKILITSLILGFLFACSANASNTPTFTEPATLQVTSTQLPATKTKPSPTDTPDPSTVTATSPPQPTGTRQPTATPSPLPPLSGSGGGVIAFTSERDGNAEIYMMNADGSDPRRVTDHRFGDYMGDWSPDGNQIVFHSTRDRKEDIYIIDLTDNKTEMNGATVRRITEDTDPNYEPVWSPDGRHIAYEARFLQAGDAEIAVIDLDTNTRKLLTDNKITDFEPDWSPDGNRILFGSLLEDNRVNLFVVNADGLDRQQLTTTQAHDWFAKWSPDGEMIAFASDRDGDVEIFVMEKDGSNQRQLTFNEGIEDIRPRWSPDGSRIAFESDRDGDFEIYIIDVEEALQNPENNTPLQITDNDVDDRRAVWETRHHPAKTLSIEVPVGTAPAINGRFSEGEWTGAKVVPLTGGGQLHLLHADGYLFLGIRAEEHGIGSICHYQTAQFL